jgi:extradiol dioxygenase family protein
MAANFHLSIPCRDIYKTRVFYSEILKAKVGRTNNAWLDINLYGNQITFVKSGDFNFEFKNYRLGEQILPSFHFGIIMDIEAFGKLYREIIQLDIGTSVKTKFMKDSVGEHLSFFVKDPDNYMLEFKCFKNDKEVFLF